MYFVYILESMHTGRFYVGQTNDLISRFNQHQQGLCPSSKSHRPWWMPYYEVHPTRADAIRRERAIKRKKSSQSIRRIIAAGYAGLGFDIPRPH